MPASFVIMRDMSSDCSLLFTDCPCAGADPTLLPGRCRSPPTRWWTSSQPRGPLG